MSRHTGRLKNTVVYGVSTDELMIGKYCGCKYIKGRLKNIFQTAFCFNRIDVGR